jgi:hypothetical protein
VSDTETPPQAEQAPAADDGAGGDDGDMEVVLTKRQLDTMFERARNSAAAEMRRNGEFKRAKAQDDPRVARGLKLLEQYEQSTGRIAEADAANAPFKDRALQSLGAKSAPAPKQAAQPAQNDQLGQLLQLLTLDVQSRLADKLPQPAVRYENAADGINAEINASIADIPEDDPRRHERVRSAVNDRLKNVRVTPVGVPRVNPNKK